MTALDFNPVAQIIVPMPININNGPIKNPIGAGLIGMQLGILLYSLYYFTRNLIDNNYNPSNKKVGVSMVIAALVGAGAVIGFFEKRQADANRQSHDEKVLAPAAP